MELLDIDLLGGLGGALFGVAAFPSVWKAIRTGSAIEVPAATIGTFWFACLTYFLWLFLKFGMHWPFLFGIAETASWTVIGWYHFFPRKLSITLDGFVKMTNEKTARERDAKEYWDAIGPCAPQCYAECDGVCSNVYTNGLLAASANPRKPTTLNDIKFAGSAENCPHDNTRGEAGGYATCLDCGGTLPDCLPALTYTRDNEEHGC